MGKIIAFANQKGGVGKTTTCVNLSSYLASKGKKVLLVDLDPQGNASSGLGVKKSELKHSTYSLLIDELPAKEIIIPTIQENLDIIPSNIDLAGAEVELVYLSGREKILKNALGPLKNKYDYITIDCPPSLGLLTINAMTSANGVIIPIQCEFYALEGLTQLMNTVKLVIKHLNPLLQVDGVALTMYDSRVQISTQIAEQIHRYFGKKVFETVIPRNVRLSESPSHGLPVLLYDKNCNGARAYSQLADEFLMRESKGGR